MWSAGIAAVHFGMTTFADLHRGAQGGMGGVHLGGLSGIPPGMPPGYPTTTPPFAGVLSRIPPSVHRSAKSRRHRKDSASGTPHRFVQPFVVYQNENRVLFYVLYVVRPSVPPGYHRGGSPRVPPGASPVVSAAVQPGVHLWGPPGGSPGGTPGEPLGVSLGGYPRWHPRGTPG
jgi:hypothetical protein